MWWKNRIIEKRKKYIYFYGKTGYGKSKCVEGIIRGTDVNNPLLPFQVSSLDKIWENVAVLSCYLKNFILTISD